jgi:hypothetical protein
MELKKTKCDFLGSDYELYISEEVEQVSKHIKIFQVLICTVTINAASDKRCNGSSFS